MDKNKLSSLIESTINSMDGVAKATPAPFLQTRINAKLKAIHEEGNSMWEKLSAFLSRPSIALAMFAFIILLNIVLYNFSESNGSLNNSLQNSQASADENLMINSFALFDIENFQP
ncbi:MAG: hypothetical protein WD135_03775 [Ferruginibacter sp.]